MAKIGMKARNEVIVKQKKRYRKSTKKAKGEILDGVCQATGLSMDRAASFISASVILSTIVMGEPLNESMAALTLSSPPERNKS
jgi:hypothetical protein